LRAYKAAERLHDALWKQNKEFWRIFKDQGESWRCVDESFINDLQLLQYREECLLIREEYQTVSRDLHCLYDSVEKKRCGVVMTGQPGIGMVILPVDNALLMPMQARPVFYTIYFSLYYTARHRFLWN